MLNNYLNKWLSDERRGLFVALLTSYFALFYHVVIFFLFLHLDISFMVFFNLASISIFTLSCLFITIKKNIIIPFVIATVEVILHQLCAIYFLGTDTSFHYLILVIGLLPSLIIEKDFKFSIPIGIISSVTFILIEVFTKQIDEFHLVDIPEG